MKFALIPIALVALWPTWITLQRLLYSRRRIILLPGMILATAALVALGTWMPFLLYQGSEVKETSLLTDFALFGIMPIIAIALSAYVIDHIADRPLAAVFTTAGCLAVAILPITFVLSEQSLAKAHNVTIIRGTTEGDEATSVGDKGTTPSTNDHEMEESTADPDSIRATSSRNPARKSSGDD